MKKKLGFLLLTMVVLPLLGWFYYNWAVNRPNYNGEGKKEVIIKPGESVSEIAQKLFSAHLINSPTLFKIYVRVNNLAPSLQAGRYKIPQNLSLPKVLELLKHGTFDIKLTFVEGLRREEMAVYAAEILKNKAIEEEFLGESENLEGYLFPDTYLFPPDITGKALVKLMGENFEKKVGSFKDESFPLTFKEVVILASVVEREAKFEKDGPVVAGILLKRYQNDWPLEADATVQYALATLHNWWPKEISKEDLKIDSPYNTRRYKGLPPTPICNPGLASLKAVIYPESSHFWYYVSDKEGKMYYATTLKEHNINVGKYME